jgi:hypothetical protein
MSLVQECLAAMRVAAARSPASSPEAYIRRVIEGWFLEVPISDIHYDNFAQWACWAFFNKEYSQLTPEEVSYNIIYTIQNNVILLSIVLSCASPNLLLKRQTLSIFYYGLSSQPCLKSHTLPLSHIHTRVYTHTQTD